MTKFIFAQFSDIQNLSTKKNKPLIRIRSKNVTLRKFFYYGKDRLEK